MKVSPIETEILKKAYCHLHDAYHNIQCLFIFLRKEYPEYANIEYAVILSGIIRMQEIEGLMGVTLNYPVFGKERDMADKEKLKEKLQALFGIDRYGYLDFDDLGYPNCINQDLHLYEVEA